MPTAVWRCNVLVVVSIIVILVILRAHTAALAGRNL